MTNATKAMLDVLDATLAKGDETARELWAVLTALRGPDIGTGYPGAKGTTTMPVRSAAFPITARAHEMNPDIFLAAFALAHSYNDLHAALEAGYHFADHVRAAALVLGLVSE